MTVVYVDSVFVLNAMVDYLLLLSTAQLAGTRLRRFRFLLAALLGGIYAVAVFLPGCECLALPPAKFAAGLLMAMVAYSGEPRFIRLVLLLLLLSCGFAGCVLALGIVAGQETPLQNGVFYTNVDMKVLLISAAAAYLILTVVFRASARRSGKEGFLIPVKVSVFGRSMPLTALCDTGNTLRDPVSGRPVLVASAEKLQALWPPELGPLLTPSAVRSPTQTLEQLARVSQNAARFRLLPYSAVGVESGLLLTVRTDWASVNGKKRERLLIALSPTAVGNGCDALWGDLER